MSKPGYVASIVMACAILHNMTIHNGLELDIPEEEEEDNRDGQNHNEEDKDWPRNQQLQRGLQARNHIIHTNFNRD